MGCLQKALSGKSLHLAAILVIPQGICFGLTRSGPYSTGWRDNKLWLENWKLQQETMCEYLPHGLSNEARKYGIFILIGHLPYCLTPEIALHWRSQLSCLATIPLYAIEELLYIAWWKNDDWLSTNYCILVAVGLFYEPLPAILYAETAFIK